MLITLTLALLVSAYVVVSQFPPAIEYARAWDAGEVPTAFTLWSGLEPPDTGWIAGCRERWSQLNR